MKKIVVLFVNLVKKSFYNSNQRNYSTFLKNVKLFLNIFLFFLLCIFKTSLGFVLKK